MTQLLEAAFAHISKLPEPQQDAYVRLILDQLEENPNGVVKPPSEALDAPKKRTRQLGMSEGKVWMADDFDAPLDDMKDYM